MTKRICLGLQRRDRDLVLHGRETGRIVRLPHGEMIEVHEPISDARKWELTQHHVHAPARGRPDDRRQRRAAAAHPGRRRSGPGCRGSTSRTGSSRRRPPRCTSWSPAVTTDAAAPAVPASSPAPPATSAAGWCPSCSPRATGCGSWPGTRRACGTTPGPATSRSCRPTPPTPASLRPALAGVEVAYYLIHALGHVAASSAPTATPPARFGAAAREAGVGRLVYLGGLAPDVPAERALGAPALAPRGRRDPARLRRARRRCCGPRSSSARARRRSRCCATSPSGCR